MDKKEQEGKERVGDEKEEEDTLGGGRNRKTRGR